MVPATEVYGIARVEGLREKDVLLLPQIEEVLIDSEIGRLKFGVPAYVQKRDVEEVYAVLARTERVSASFVQPDGPNLGI